MYEIQDKDEWMAARWEGETCEQQECDGPADGMLLPKWDAIRASDPPQLNPALIPGILRRGYIGIVGGKKKVGKTLLTMQLEVCAAAGGEFLGHPIAGGLRCMHIDPEVHPSELHNRFARICKVMDKPTSAIDSNIVKWSLRGVTVDNGRPVTIADVAHDIELRCQPGDFDLIVIDSASALIEGDENSSRELHRFFAHVHRIAKATDATVIAVAHFGKAKDGDREAADRVRGSSVWGDTPDAVLTLTEVFPKDGSPSDYLDDGETAFLLESGGLRSFGHMEPLPLLFRFPCFRVDTEGIAENWMPASSMGQIRGGKQTGELNRTRAERDWMQSQLALAAEFIRRGVGAEGMAMTDASQIIGMRSDKLREKIIDKGSDLFTYDKRKGKNVLIVKEMPKPPPTLNLDYQSPTCPPI